MSTDANLSPTLYEANLALWLRTMQLLQQGSEQCLEQGTRAVHKSIEEISGQVDQLRSRQDWQSVAALPNEAAWRVLNRQLDGMQATIQTGIAIQTVFSSGVRQAFAKWQQESAVALRQAGNACPLTTRIREFVQKWGRLPAPSTPQAARAPKAAGKEAFNG